MTCLAFSLKPAEMTTRWINSGAGRLAYFAVWDAIVAVFAVPLELMVDEASTPSGDFSGGLPRPSGDAVERRNRSANEDWCLACAGAAADRRHVDCAPRRPV